MKQGKLLPIPPPEQLSVEDTVVIHTRILEESLRNLGDGRAGEDVKLDVMQWVREEGLYPCSFDACCAVVGVRAENTRSAVERLIKRLKQRRKQ